MGDSTIIAESRRPAGSKMHHHVAALLRERSGHFVYESGHHGETWLELELLFWRPGRMQGVAAALAERIAAHRPEAVCGPLEEGAFLALLVALQLGLPFAYSIREPSAGPTRYTIPRLPATELAGKKVAIVDDVINAGSAVSGTMAGLLQARATPVAVGAMAVYGDAARDFAGANGLALEALAEFPARIWDPGDCPLCARGIALSGQKSANNQETA